MYIHSISLYNFKAFLAPSDEGSDSKQQNSPNENKITFSRGVNYLVGDNNVGKTTILKAIDFLINGGEKKDVLSISVKGQEDVYVEIVLKDVKDFKTESLEKYNSYIDTAEDRQLILQRSSKEENGTDIKHIRIFNPKTREYEKLVCTRNTITDIINPQIVYANMHNEDYQDFGTTKLISKLITKTLENNHDNNLEENLKEFKEAHKKFFGEDVIKKGLSKTQQSLADILKEQFGDSQIEFEFSLPKVNDFIKMGRINCIENGVKTDISEKGSGLQRVFALAIIQEYSKISDNNDDDNIQYFIDEPEIYLHPRAQDKLINSLVELSENGSQVFITTHSPYILRHYREDNGKKDSINILSLKKGNKGRKIEGVESLLLTPTSIAEVTYKAFGVPNVDFHQMLFSEIYISWVEEYSREHKDSTLAKFDEEYLQKKHKLPTEKFTPRVRGKWQEEQDRTIPYIVRNEIDHPETLEREKNIWSEDNLRNSIDILQKIYKEDKI